MTTQATSPVGGMLQFDRAEPVDPTQATDAAAARCGTCDTSLQSEYFDIGGVPSCQPCKDRIVAHATPVRGVGTTVRAMLYGFGAAIVGAVLYYAVIAITEFEIGLVAIVTGYMVGWAVRRGARGRGGRRLQLAAAGLTYLSVALAYTPLAVKGAMEADAVAADSAQASFGATQAPLDAAADPSMTVALQGTADATTTPGAAEAEWVGPIGFAIAAGLIVALPLLMIFGSLPSGLISALIIGFGMHQAWRMTGVDVLVVSGPLAVGRPDGVPPAGVEPAV